MKERGITGPGAFRHGRVGWKTKPHSLSSERDHAYQPAKWHRAHTILHAPPTRVQLTHMLEHHARHQAAECILSCEGKSAEETPELALTTRPVMDRKGGRGMHTLLWQMQVQC